jgi:hypothetical protein
MPKALCISGMVIAVLIFILFLSDFVLGLINENIAPFKGASPMMDIVFILCAVGLALLSWNTFKEQV